MNLKQSRLGSLREQLISTFSGFGLSLLLQWLFFDVYLGYPLHPVQNLTFAAIMTVVSIGRGYLIRRVAEHFGMRAKLSPALQLVAFERLRQQTVEGYDADRDDAYPAGELAAAAAAYLLTARSADVGGAHIDPADIFPWTVEHWKPADVKRNLVKGCALGIAELDRLERMRRRKGRKS